MSGIRKIMSLAMGAVVMSACATKGFVRQQVTTGVTAEQVARVAADSNLSSNLTGTMTSEFASVRAEIGSVKNDVAALRRDLTALRTEFGAKITAMENGMKFAFPVNFAFDDASVRDGDRPALDRFAQVVAKYYGGSVVTVEGFADPAGSRKYNLDLSKRRADNVASYLTQVGLSTVALKAVGYGAERQVVEGAERDMPGAQANRRVVFVVETAAGATGITQ